MASARVLDRPPEFSPVFRIVGVPPPEYPGSCSLSSRSVSTDDDDDELPSSVLFPSMRLMLAALLCSCFITLSISSSNMAVALICMTACPVHGYGGDLKWSPDEEGVVLAAQNAGSLLMIVTGACADRLNGKWMVFVALLLCVSANALLPVLARDSVWLAVGARLAVGMADACLQPATNSLITRWFPQAERAAAIGLITGGRQIGTLFILPTAGYLCTRKDVLEGWPAIFYLSASISLLVCVFWLPIGADKPAKQCCISHREKLFIESRIACESIGKRTDRDRRVPWKAMFCSKPLWAAVFALVCHEFPLVIMLQFLPNYMRDVLAFSPTKNGALSALPIAFLFVSKTASSSLSSFLTNTLHWDRTLTFNGVASAGLSVSIFLVPHFGKDSVVFAVVALCSACVFAGLHTPGVQTALVQLAPPFSGIITGISFFVVGLFGIANKILTKGSESEWATVFYLSSFVAALPVVIFSWWGSADRELWAAPSSKNSVHSFSSKTSLASKNFDGSSLSSKS